MRYWSTPASVSRHRGCDLNTIQIIGAVLLSLGGLTGAGTFLYGKLSKPATPPGTRVDSDAPAPVGITEYMDLVAKASPTATAETRWGYASLGCTEAEVLRMEVVRLGEKNS